MSERELDPIVSVPLNDLAALSAVALRYLLQDAHAQQANAHALVDHLQRAVNMKYAATAAAHRLAQANPTESVQFDDDGVPLIATWSTTVDWDQAQLAAIAKHLIASGEDPAHYLEVQYRVADATFHAWPTPLKTAFAPARTCDTAPPVIAFAAASEAPR